MTLGHFLKYRRLYEAALWTAFVLINNTIIALSVLTETKREGNAVATWEPFVWEYTSAVMLLVLLLGIIAFDRRYPLAIGKLRSRLPLHLAAAVIFGLLHTTGIVALRKLIYASVGETYTFGNLPTEVLYELRKQIWTYAQMLAVIYAYRFILARLRGEATIPELDERAPADSTARPQRFLVKKLGKEFLVRVDDIDWIEAAGNYVNLRVGDRLFPLRSTMQDIESKLDANRFARIHRSAIVNLDRVATIEPEPGGEATVTLDSGVQLSASRTYRPRLQAAIQP